MGAGTKRINLASRSRRHYCARPSRETTPCIPDCFIFPPLSPPGIYPSEVRVSSDTRGSPSIVTLWHLTHNEPCTTPPSLEHPLVTCVVLVSCQLPGIYSRCGVVYFAQPPPPPPPPPFLPRSPPPHALPLSLFRRHTLSCL